MVQGVPGVWLDRPNVGKYEKLVSGMYKVYGRGGEDGGGLVNRESIDA